MNLYFRVLRVILAARFRARAQVLEETVVRFRVWPTDLDYLLHMNNGRYLSLMDLGRYDLVTRTGFANEFRRRGWYPVVAGEAIRFKKSLQPFARFELRTRTLGWDDRSFYMEQRFVRHGEVIAVAVVRARFLSRDGGTVNAHDMVEAISPGTQSPPLPPYIAAWREAERGMSA